MGEFQKRYLDKVTKKCGNCAGFIDGSLQSWCDYCDKEIKVSNDACEKWEPNDYVCNDMNKAELRQLRDKVAELEQYLHDAEIIGERRAEQSLIEFNRSEAAEKRVRVLEGALRDIYNLLIYKSSQIMSKEERRAYAIAQQALGVGK